MFSHYLIYMNNSNNKNKHLTLEQREKILEYLNDGYSVSEIACHLSKNKSTISKEIKKHRIEHRLNSGVNSTCAKFKECKHTNLCDVIKCKDKQCRTCEICRTVCLDFEISICKRLIRAPYVCDGCQSKHGCRKPIKFSYKPSVAQKEYETVLVDSRTGINMTEEELVRLNKLITPLVKDNSQSLNHIFATHKEEIGVSISTVYNYIDDNILECSNIDLPRRVKYKKRKSSTKKESIKPI